MQTVRLHLRSGTKLRLTEDKFPFQEKDSVEFVNAFSEESEGDYPPTLKDISTIFYTMIGHGVTWQLAYELSKRITPDVSKNPYELSEILGEIFSEYYDMSEEEAWEKFEEYPRLYPPQSPASTDYDI